MGRKSNRKNYGLSVIEVLSVIAILMVITIAVMIAFKPRLQIEKARDSRRKADLSLIAKAVEDYANDNPCYPSSTNLTSYLSDCDGSSFRPYLDKIPCDPGTKQPYVYESPDCQKYALYASLVTENVNLSYKTESGEKGNYVVSSPSYPLVPEEVSSESPTESPTSIPPTQTPTSTPLYRYGCFAGICQELGPYQECQPNYDVPDCRGWCARGEEYECTSY